LIELTFRNAASDLLRFPEAQLNQGFWYLASTACSDYLSTLRSDKVPLERRLSAIDINFRALSGLFSAAMHADVESLRPEAFITIELYLLHVLERLPNLYLCDYP